MIEYVFKYSLIRFINLIGVYYFFNYREERSMKKTISSISAVVTLAALFVMPMEAGAKEMTDEEVTFGRKAGNCLACHMIPGGNLPGTIGPPLLAMKARYPDKAVLRAQIWDATIKNPDSIMPPFGKHEILTEKQVDQVTNYIYSK
jgi:sulfur-oxidizing protein SoxX